MSPMLRFGLASSKVFALLFAIYCVVASEISAQKSNDDVGFLQQRHRLGKFNEKNPGVFFDAYSEHFTKDRQLTDKRLVDINQDDWRRYRPTAEQCLDLLIIFTSSEYVPTKPYDIISLDSCLEWLYQDGEKDKFMKQDLEMLDYMEADYIEAVEDQNLRDIYDGARPNDWPQDLQVKVREYFTTLLDINQAYPGYGCHGLWLTAYNNFIEDVYVAGCEDENNCNFFGLPKEKVDTYLQLIADSTKLAAQNCYEIMIVKPIHELDRSKSYFPKKRTEVDHVTSEMRKILQLVTGETGESVDLGLVAIRLKDMKDESLEQNGSRSTLEKFSAKLGEYATNNYKIDETDSTGRKQYGKIMASLCNTYANHNKFIQRIGGKRGDQTAKQDPFEIYTIIYSLVRLTNHEPILGLSKEKFEEEVVHNQWDPLYLTTFTCQVILQTIAVNDNSNRRALKVIYRKNFFTDIIDWPIARMSTTLPIIYGIKSPEPIARPSSQVAPPVKSKFKTGFRFKDLFSKTPDKQQVNESYQRPAYMPEVKKYVPPSANEISGYDRLPQSPARQPYYQPPQIGHVSISPTPATAMQIPNSPVQKQHVISKKNVIMYARLHGYYPKAINVEELYPDLPKDPRDLPKDTRDLIK